jgi:hypothetical protein
LFEEPLKMLYEEIYLLARKVGLSPDYIETISPAERKLYWNIHLDQIKREEDSDRDVNTYNVMSPNLPTNMVSGKLQGGIRVG